MPGDDRPAKIRRQAFFEDAAADAPASGPPPVKKLSEAEDFFGDLHREPIEQAPARPAGSVAGRFTYFEGEPEQPDSPAPAGTVRGKVGLWDHVPAAAVPVGAVTEKEEYFDDVAPLEVEVGQIEVLDELSCAAAITEAEEAAQAEERQRLAEIEAKRQARQEARARRAEAQPPEAAPKSQPAPVASPATPALAPAAPVDDPLGDLPRDTLGTGILVAGILFFVVLSIVAAQHLLSSGDSWVLQLVDALSGGPEAAP